MSGFNALDQALHDAESARERRKQSDALLEEQVQENTRLRAALEKAERERDTALTAAKKHLVGHVREGELEVASLADCIEGLAASWQASSDDEDRVQRGNAELREAIQALGVFLKHADPDCCGTIKEHEAAKTAVAILQRLDAGEDGG